MSTASSTNCFSSAEDLKLREKLEKLIASGTSNPNETIDKLRATILLEGLPSETTQERECIAQNKGGCSLRGRIWKIFLRIGQMDADYYMKLVENGPCEDYNKIISDKKRALNLSKDIQETVNEAKVGRVLSSFCIACGGSQSKYKYVQLTSTLVAMLLRFMGELDAFYSLKRIIIHVVPTYVFGENCFLGPEAGCSLIMEIIKSADNELYQALLSNPTESGKKFGMKSDDGRWAMSSVQSFMAEFNPKPEVYKLWDFFFAFGLHMNIVCNAAMAILERDKLLAMSATTERAQYLFTQLKLVELNASKVVTLASSLVRELPESLYVEIATHCTDEAVATKWKDMYKKK